MTEPATQPNPTSIRNIIGYRTSRDHRRLLDLMRSQPIICIVDFDFHKDELPCRDIARTQYELREDASEIFQIGARGIEYIWADTEDKFLKKCDFYNVEFLEPNA